MQLDALQSKSYKYSEVIIYRSLKKSTLVENWGVSCRNLADSSRFLHDTAFLSKISGRFLQDNHFSAELLQKDNWNIGNFEV